MDNEKSVAGDINMNDEMVFTGINSWINKIICKTVNEVNADKAKYVCTCKYKIIKDLDDKKKMSLLLKYRAFFKPSCFFDVSVDFLISVTFQDEIKEWTEDDTREIINISIKEFGYIVGQMTSLTHGSPFLTDRYSEIVKIVEDK
ncbi:MAG: hypothetical protein RR625_02735 [Christensenellaceae bacterium]